MITEKLKDKAGFTLTELMVTIAMAVIIILGIGVVLVDSQKGWNKMYNRVHRGMVTDGYVARKAFDAAVRKSSIKRSLISTNPPGVCVYYYSDPNTLQPDRYANFYKKNDTLVADYGHYDWNTKKAQPPSSTFTLAQNVKTVDFSVAASSVRMVLQLDDGSDTMTVTTSAVRHNE